MKQKLDMQGSNELMFGAELLDGRVLQGLQDRFCACNNLYCVCLSQTQGVVTTAYGSKEERRTNRSRDKDTYPTPRCGRSLRLKIRLSYIRCRELFQAG